MDNNPFYSIPQYSGQHNQTLKLIKHMFFVDSEFLCNVTTIHIFFTIAMILFFPWDFFSNLSLKIYNPRPTLVTRSTDYNWSGTHLSFILPYYFFFIEPNIFLDASLWSIVLGSPYQWLKIDSSLPLSPLLFILQTTSIKYTTTHSHFFDNSGSKKMFSA